MLEVEIQVFAVALEVLFGRPRPYEKEKIDDLATCLTDTTEGFALRPEQVRVRHTRPGRETSGRMPRGYP